MNNLIEFRPLVLCQRLLRDHSDDLPDVRSDHVRLFREESLQKHQFQFLLALQLREQRRHVSLQQDRSQLPIVLLLYVTHILLHSRSAKVSSPKQESTLPALCTLSEISLLLGFSHCHLRARKITKLKAVPN